MGYSSYSKYVKHCLVVDCIPKGSDSFTWKGILKSLASVHGGFGWTTENGANVSLWFDIWLGTNPYAWKWKKLTLRIFCVRW